MPGIFIDGLEYDQDLFWEDEFATPRRLGSRRQTCGVGGATVYQNIQTDIKKVFSLTARFDADGWLGHWTRGQVKALEILEQTGAVVSIIYEDREIQAMVAPGGLAALVARHPRPNAEDSDWYYGSVVFWEV